jgi:hypothetical protein
VSWVCRQVVYKRSVSEGWRTWAKASVRPGVCIRLPWPVVEHCDLNGARHVKMPKESPVQQRVLI